MIYIITTKTTFADHSSSVHTNIVELHKLQNPLFLTMMPYGLVNSGVICWLNSMLVSLESCDSFVAVFKMYENNIEKDASRPLSIVQENRNVSSLLCKFSQFFKRRRSEPDAKIAPDEIVKALNSQLFSSDIQIDLNDSWTPIIEQLMNELGKINSNWSQSMLKDICALVEVMYLNHETCVNDQSTSDKCASLANSTHECKSYYLWRNPGLIFVEDEAQCGGKKSKQKSNTTYNLTKYISTHNKPIVNHTCVYCEGQTSTHYEITKYPVILKIDIWRSDSEIYHKTRVSVDLELFLNDVKYNFVAACYQDHQEYTEEAGYLGHNTATVLRGEKMYEMDDENVKERNIPKSKMLQSSKLICVFYERDDWSEIISLDITNIYESAIINKYRKHSEEEKEEKEEVDLLADRTLKLCNEGEIF